MEQLQEEGEALERANEEHVMINKKHLQFLQNVFCTEHAEPGEFIAEEPTVEDWRSCLCGNDFINISTSCLSQYLNVTLQTDDLYQDYEMLLNWPSFPERFLIPVLFGLIFLAGVAGNGMVLYVVVRSGMKSGNTVSNLYFGNLALADLLYIVFCVPTTAITYVLPSWPFGTAACKYIFAVLFNIFNDVLTQLWYNKVELLKT